jgi:hypothetical protein
MYNLFPGRNYNPFFFLSWCTAPPSGTNGMQHFWKEIQSQIKYNHQCHRYAGQRIQRIEVYIPYFRLKSNNQTDPEVVVLKIVWRRNVSIKHEVTVVSLLFNSFGFLSKSDTGATYNCSYPLPAGYIARWRLYCDNITTHTRLQAVRSSFFKCYFAHCHWMPVLNMSLFLFLWNYPLWFSFNQFNQQEKKQ